MSETKVSVYQTHRELHVLGDYVAVAWNSKKEKRAIEGEDGLTYQAIVPVRNSAPYIDFVAIRFYGTECYEDEDSPAKGGLNVRAAEQIVKELTEAIAYLRGLP